MSGRSVGRLEVFLSRYTISKPAVIIEIDPSSGAVLREFPQPADWEWDSSRAHAHWEEYRGRKFLVYFYDDQLIFQVDHERHVLDSSYSSELERLFGFWLRFVLRKNDDVVLRFVYRDPQTRFSSLLWDDWWDWDTPFEFVHEYLARRRPA
jgi:hypothetical protein